MCSDNKIMISFVKPKFKKIDIINTDEKSQYTSLLFVEDS